MRHIAPVNIYQDILQHNLRLGQGCPPAGGPPHTRIDFRSQRGVFVIFGAFVGAAGEAARQPARHLLDAAPKRPLEHLDSLPFLEHRTVEAT